MRVFDRLPSAEIAELDQARSLKVCVVTSEILGPVKNGGIGTATSGLLDHLAETGQQVTVLYTLVENGVPECAERDWNYWVKDLAAKGITLAHLPHADSYRAWLQKSWLVKEFLAQHDYDVVYFNEHHGSGYYTLAAKRAGLSPFVDRVHCVITHGAIEWVFNVNNQLLQRPSDLQLIGIERRSVEWADFVIGPSQYLLREYEKYGWKLPNHTYCQPYPLSLARHTVDEQLVQVDELVFFGRLETRKGVWLFCDALDRLGNRLRGKTVTFMGRSTDVGGIPTSVFILERSAKWPCKLNFLLEFGQDEALAYLSQSGRVAVMPSLADNSPCVVYECMQQRIPFVASSGSGADELIHPDCWPWVMVEPTSTQLADRLGKVLETGAGLAWPRFNAVENLARWTNWGQALSVPEARRRLGLVPPRSDEDLGSKPPAAISLLLIDDQFTELGALFDSLQLQVQRFGNSVSYSLLSCRDEPLRGLIRGTMEALAATTGSTASVIGPDDLPQFLSNLGAADCVFVFDSSVELRAGFLASAVRLFTDKAAVAVTCIEAQRESSAAPAVIVELAAGDLPAAGGLGMRLTSSAWAVAGTTIASHISPGLLYDDSTGELATAAEAGQLLFHKLLLANQPVRLVPEVGGIRTESAYKSPRRRHWYRSAVEHARDLGVAPYVYPQPAPWLSISSYGYRDETPAEQVVVNGDLPDTHPLKELSYTGSESADIAKYAAALGRVNQAAQIGVTGPGDAPDFTELMDIGVQSIRSRPVLDLKALLVETSGSDTLPENLRPASTSRVRISASNATLETRDSSLIINDIDSDGGMMGLTFFDVFLCGHDTALVELQALGAAPCEFRLIIIDQAMGTVMADVETALGGGRVEVVSVPLNGVYGLYCIIVEISPASKGSASPLGLRVSRMQIT